MNLKFLHSVSLEDYSKYVRYYSRKNKSYSVLGLLLGFFFFYEASVVTYLESKEITLIAIHFIPVIIVAIFYFVFQIKEPNVKAVYNSYTEYINNVECTINDEGIYSSYTNGDYYFFKWKNLLNIEHFEDIIIISIHEQSAYIFNVNKLDKDVKDFILSKQKKQSVDAGYHLVD